MELSDVEGTAPEATHESLQNELDATLALEAELRDEAVAMENSDMEVTSSEFAAEMSRLTRTHVCRLCLRWFGHTFAGGQGHYTDLKTDFVKRQRARNRKPSYLMCASCTDLPLLCHACFKMMHLQEEPLTVSCIEALQSELQRREHATGPPSRSPSAVGDDTSDERDASNASPSSQTDMGVINKSFDAAPLPANLLKRSGLAALSTTDHRLSSPMPSDRRHIALEMFTMDPLVAERQRGAAKKLFSVSLTSFFDTHFSNVCTEIDKTLNWVPQQVALDATQQRENDRRQEIMRLWQQERFSGQYLLLPPSKDATGAIDPQPTIVIEGEDERNANPSASTEQPLVPVSPLLPIAMAQVPQINTLLLNNASFHSDVSPRESHTSNGTTAWFLVDTFALGFVVEIFEDTCASLVEEEQLARKSLGALSLRCRDGVQAFEGSLSAMRALYGDTMSCAWLRANEDSCGASFDSDWLEPLGHYFEHIIQRKVVRVLDGSDLHESGALDSEAVDDDGCPMTLRWMRLDFQESVARRVLWDEQVDDWQPLMKDAAWRAQQIERFLLSRQFFQQHNFHANQVLRQFYVAHTSTVAEKMISFLTLMMERSESRTEQLMLQSAHAVTRHEFIEDERMERWQFKQMYAVSRLVARESAQRRAFTGDAWSIMAKELPTEEKLKRFSMERVFVVEYRLMLKEFGCSTRMDLVTLVRNCPTSFELSLSDWTRRLAARESTYFSYFRDRNAIAGPCGLPVMECFEWPPDARRQLSLFWCPTFGPARKKVVLVQGQAARSLRARPKPSKLLPGVAKASSALLAASHTGAEELTPRSPLGLVNQVAASPTAKVVDDGPQPLLSHLSVVSALLEVPSFGGSSCSRFSCTALVEDVVCWTKVCQQGQVLLGSYQEANAFDELFAAFDDVVKEEAEIKWAAAVSLRERERLAKLEQYLGHRGPPKVKSAPMATRAPAGRKKRRRNISDSASSVISAEDAASTIASTTETARSRQTAKTDGSSEQRQEYGTGMRLDVLQPTSELAVAVLPNYAMRESFFGTRFMFGESIHFFERQWIPPTRVSHMIVPEDVSTVWGRGIDEDTGSDEEDHDEAMDDDGDIASDFGDDAVAAPSRRRDAYLDRTVASIQRQTLKHEEAHSMAKAAEDAAALHRNTQMQLFWQRVHNKQRLEQQQGGGGVAASGASTAAPAGGTHGKKLPPRELSPSLLGMPRRPAEDGAGPLSISSNRIGASPSKRQATISAPTPRVRGGPAKRRGSVALADAFDMLEE